MAKEIKDREQLMDILLELGNESFTEQLALSYMLTEDEWITS
jgi:hypothetical protein